jgi:hypothetical protein
MTSVLATNLPVSPLDYRTGYPVTLKFLTSSQSLILLPNWLFTLTGYYNRFFLLNQLSVF